MGSSMRAAVCTGYGPPEVLQVEEVATPSPGRNEVLVKVHASTVSSSDTFVRSGIPTAPLFTRMTMRMLVGFARPRKRILGLILAGEVEQTGRDVRRFQVGDRVWAFTKFNFGGYAQYASLPESSTVGLAPVGLSYETAAAVPYGGLLGLHYLRAGGITTRRRVLVYGASGAVGTSAVQLAKHFGAHVTGVCGTSNLDLVRSLGSDATIDYTTEDSPDGGASYDLVLDAVGKRKSSPLKVAAQEAIALGGAYVSVDDGTPKLPASDLDILKDLVESGDLRPVVDCTYPLEQIAEAHRYVEEEHKRGNVVITIPHHTV